MFKLFINLIVLSGFTTILTSAEYYVDNVKGNDANAGSKEAPFKTIVKTLKVFKGGDTLHLVPNPEPYREKLYIVGKQYNGTKEKRTIIDGHGAQFDWRVPFPVSAWRNEGGGVFSKKLINNAHVMDHSLGHWSGGFPIVFFDGKPGSNCAKKDELMPFTYFLLKIPMKKGQKKRDPLHNTLYIKLPDGKTPDDIKVETFKDRMAVGTECSYVTIKNIKARYTGGDCFSSTWGKNIIFENVEGCFAMDQGISNHGSEVTIINSRFHHNTGCGIVDVYPQCKTKYINCIISEDLFRGGIEFYKGTFEMENCIIRNNARNALTVNIEAKVKIKNCLFIGPEKKDNIGIYLSPTCQFEMQNCTVCNFKRGLVPGAWTTVSKAQVSYSAFINCGTAYWFGRTSKPEIVPDLTSDHNYFSPGNFVIDFKKYDFAGYQKAKGQDKDSIVEASYPGSIPPYQIQSDKIKGEKTIGAVLKNEK